MLPLNPKEDSIKTSSQTSPRRRCWRKISLKDLVTFGLLSSATSSHNLGSTFGYTLSYPTCSRHLLLRWRWSYPTPMPRTVPLGNKSLSTLGQRLEIVNLRRACARHVDLVRFRFLRKVVDPLQTFLGTQNKILFSDNTQVSLSWI